MRQRPFAVFDIDGTVIRWQLYHSIVNELGKRGKISPAAVNEIHESRMTWKRRTHSESFNEYERVLIYAYHQALTDLRVSDYLQAVDTVFDEYKEQTYTYTRDMIRRLKQEGYTLIALSGSQQEIIQKLADFYQFDIAVGAQYERAGEVFTSNMVSPVFDKGAYLRNIIAEHQLRLNGSIAIGDSEGDIPVLAMVDTPIAFNPNRKLYEEARANGWKIVIERKNMIYKLSLEDNGYRLTS